MIKLKFWFFIVVNVTLCLVGVISIQAGIINNGPLVRPLLDAIGIGLLAAGAVNILDRTLTLEPPPTPPAPVPRIEVVAEKRLATPQEILDLKYKAAKVDLIGVSLNHVFKELINDPRQGIIDRLLSHNLQLRLFILHPDSIYLEQRAREDKLDIAKLVERQRQAVRLCVDFYEQLRARYDSAKDLGILDTHMTGSLQIKLLDFCPYITIYRVDDDIFWGLYTSHTTGVDLPLFKTSMNHDPGLYKHLHEHIHGLMDRDLKYPDLVSMPEMGEPCLNEGLAAAFREDM
jgi:hypothetical protein